MEPFRAREARANARRLLPLLQEHADPYLEKVSRLATCKRGCASCCHQVVGSTLLEGVHIADAAERSPVWAHRIPELRAALAREVAFLKGAADVTASSFLGRRACVFLDAATKECSIYDVRPVACRFHLVVTPASACAPDAIHPVNILDTRGAVESFLGRVRELALKVPRVDGPLPEMVIAGFEYLARTPRDFRQWVRRTHTGELGDRLLTAARNAQPSSLTATGEFQPVSVGKGRAARR